MTEVSKLNRFLASLIDCVVAFGPGIFIGFLGLGLIDTILSLLGLGYFLLKDALFEGQSIGQQSMKYAAVKEDGSSLKGDFATSALRNVTVFIPFLDAILVLLDKPRLGETLAKTKVVNKG